MTSAIRSSVLVVASVVALSCDRDRDRDRVQVTSTPPSSSAIPMTSIDPPAARGMAPNLLAHEGGAILTWLEPVDEAGTTHRLRLSKLTAATWSTPVTIAEGPKLVANWADVPSVAIGGDKAMVAHWAEKSASPIAHAYDVVLARSTDGGATWQRLGTPHRDGIAAEHGFVSLLPDDGAVLAVWLDGRMAERGGPTTLRAARIEKTMGPEQIIEERVCDCCSTSAARTATGPVVVYRDRDGGELRDPWITRRVDDRWTQNAVHVDRWQIAGCPVNGPMVVAEGRDVAVAWYTNAAQRPAVKVAFSIDAGATFGAAIEVDGPTGTRAPIGRVDLVLEHSGEAIVSWTASERETGQILVRRIARGGLRGRELAIASVAAGREAGFPRVESVGDDLLIAWTDADVGSLRATRLARRAVPEVAPEPKAAASAAPRRLEVGAPAYAARTLVGNTPTTLASRRGKPVLLNIWATWCEPCRHELPVLAQVKQRYGARGLQVIATSVDREAAADKIQKLAARLAPGVEAWHDAKDLASGTFGVANVPTTLLFDAEGVLRWRHDGAIAADDPALEDALRRVLR